MTYWKNDVYYNEKYSATFEVKKRNVLGNLTGYEEKKNTWTDWHLIPLSRPVIAPPEEKKTYVDIPGAYGQLDLSGSLTYYPLYERRTGELEFAVLNESYGFESSEKTYSEIMRWFNDEHCSVSDMRMTINDEKEYCYEGHFKVSSFEHGESYSEIRISYDVYPFKRELCSSLERWKWDPFSFETGIIRNYGQIIVPPIGNKTLVIPGSAEYIVPKITVSVMNNENNPIKVHYLEPVDYTLHTGINIFPELLIGLSPATFIFKGGTSDNQGGGLLSIEYRGGWL